VGGGGRERIQKVTALKLQRQCPLVLLIKIILEEWWGIVESRKWSEKKWAVFGYAAGERGRAFWVELRVV
jgi:hypothetical protein